MVNTEDFYHYLLKKELKFFVGVPDSLLKDLCACITSNSKKENNIIAANEGNALAIACGRYLSTSKMGVIYMQNSGLGNIVNPLLSLADELVYNIPSLLIIGYRGEVNVHDEPQHIKQGMLTLPLLDTLGVKYLILDENYQEQIDYCYQYMLETKKTIALVVRKNTFTSYKLEKNNNKYTLSREESLKKIIELLDKDDFIVSTTGKTSREVFEIREARHEDHAHDFLTVGSMGHTSSIALGMSLGTKKNVYCIDGDGSFIMHMGSSAIVASNAPKNLKYIIINNGSHESVGGQPTVGFKINMKKILKGVGFKHVYEAFNEVDIEKTIPILKNNSKCALVIYTKEGARDNLGRPTKSPIENKESIMRKLNESNHL